MKRSLSLISTIVLLMACNQSAAVKQPEVPTCNVMGLQLEAKTVCCPLMCSSPIKYPVGVYLDCADSLSASHNCSYNQNAEVELMAYECHCGR